MSTGIANAKVADQSKENADTTPLRVSFYWENDGAVALKPNHNTDRHYTSGVGLSLTYQIKGAELGEDNAAPEGSAWGLLAGHEIYTPDNLLANPPDAQDRPYAGYAYLGGFWQRQQGDHLDHLQLNLGVVGPSARGEEVQTWVHDTFTGDDPQGWDNQLADEFAAQFTYRHKYRHKLPGFDPRQTDWDHQIIPYAALNLGTVERSAEAGAIYRLGFKLPDDFGPDQLHDIGSFTASPELEPGWSAYGFARVSGRYVEWNTFLEGSYAEDPSPSVSAEPWVGEGQVGVAVAYRGPHCQVELVYGQTYLTREFEEQDDDNGYGGLTLRWSSSF